MQNTNTRDDSTIYAKLAKLLNDAATQMSLKVQEGSPHAKITAMEYGYFIKDKEEEGKILQVSWYEHPQRSSKDENALNTNLTGNVTHLGGISNNLGDMLNVLEHKAGISAEGDEPKNNSYLNVRTEIPTLGNLRIPI